MKTIIRRFMFKNKTIVFIDQAMISGSNFLTFVLAARILGVESFGVFSISWVVVLFVSSLVMAVVVFPMSSNYPLLSEDKKKEYVKACHILYLFIITPFIFLCLGGAYFFVDNDLFLVAILVAATCFILYYQELWRRTFVLFESYTKLIITDILCYILRILALIIVLFLETEVIIKVETIYYIVIASASSAIAYVIRDNSISYFPLVFDDLKSSFFLNCKSAKWLLPSNLMVWSSVNFYLVISPFLLTPASLGIFKACQNLVSCLNVLVQAAETIIPVSFSNKLKSYGREELNSEFIRVVFLGGGPFLLLIPIFYFLGEKILIILYGIDYSGTKYVLFYLSCLQVTSFLAIPIRAYLRTTDKTNVWFLSYTAASVVTLIVSYPLVSIFGNKGMAIGMLLANLILIFASCAYIYLFCIKSYKGRFNEQFENS